MWNFRGGCGGRNGKLAPQDGVVGSKKDFYLKLKSFQQGIVKKWLISLGLALVLTNTIYFSRPL